MEKNWEKNLSVYIERTISPDGRDTFESTQALIEQMFEFATVKKGNKVMIQGLPEAVQELRGIADQPLPLLAEQTDISCRRP